MISLWIWTVAVWTGGILVGVALASALASNKEPLTRVGQDAVDEAEAILAIQPGDAPRGGQS